MSNRLVRINELVQREVSAYLRKHYQSESARITITGVDVAQDLKTGKVYVSVIGSVEEREAGLRWLRSKAGELRRHVGATVVMKWTPELTYLADATPERAARVLQIIDEIEKGGSQPSKS
ncbi:ribosome-binding factor A [mine drainage metagenome]|uniref:Ribosome-binding factor A n=1 Tax=mine drainage metagenome TaxID=410659 RepID=A0A1J5TQM1_9ZZZZ